MPIVNDWELILRLLIAIICGFVVGMERKNRSKEAGVRTHTIICLGSCLLMIVSKYGFDDIGLVNLMQLVLLLRLSVVLVS